MGNYDKKLYQTLGYYLRKSRETKNLSLEFVADKIGKTKKTVSRYELGEHRIDTETLQDICNAIGISYTELNKKVEKELYDNSNHSQWGDDRANVEYLQDKPELLELYNEIRDREDIYILFDKTKDLGPKDVESVLMFVQTIRNQRGLD